MSIKDHDKKIVQCRILGHGVPFSFCRKGVSGQPCRKIFDCWYQSFNIAEFIKRHYAEDEIKELIALSNEKRDSNTELLEKTTKKH